MNKEIKFALYAIKKNIQNGAELRGSFLMNVFGMVINNVAFIFLWVYFIKSVGVVGGWTAADIIGLQVFVAISYGFVFSTMMGIRKIPEYISAGSFDRFMLSPKNLLIRIATASFNASAIGDLIFGLICFAVYVVLISATIYQFLLMLILVFFATIALLAVTILIGATSFFFMDPDAVTKGFFDLFFTPSMFHGGAFQGYLRFVFTFIIPSLVIGALPVEAVRTMSLGKLVLVGVLSFAWLFISLKFFKYAVKKYESSNFMTFGN
ncbi:MAG: ABC-2 family transporter protein [Patescibacteria group bacterium]